MTHDRQPARARLASWLVAHAGRAMPPSRQGWAVAMRHELPYVDGDWQRLSWAFGCLMAGYRERFRTWRAIDMLLRITVAFLLAFKVFEAFFPSVLTFAYRAGMLNVATALGGATVGDDYRRLIPLMEGIPVWLHLLSVLVGALYLAAIAQTLLGNRIAYVLVLAAIGVQAIIAVVERPILDAIGVRANPNPSILAAIVLPYVLPLVLAAALWWEARARPVTPAHA